MLRPVPSFRLEESQSQMSGHSEDFNDNHQRKLDVAGGLNKCDEDSPKEGASQESKEGKGTILRVQGRESCQKALKRYKLAAEMTIVNTVAIHTGRRNHPLNDNDLQEKE